MFKQIECLRIRRAGLAGMGLLLACASGLSLADALSSDVTWSVIGRDITITQPTFSSVGDGSFSGNAATVMPGSSVTLAGNYTIQEGNTGYCPDCIIQLYTASIAPAQASSEGFFSGIIQPGFGTRNGSFATHLTAPTTPGTYFVGLGSSLDYVYLSNVAGAFGNNNTGTPGFAPFEITVLPNIPFGTAITTDPGLTSNQQSVAAAVDEACAAPTSGLISRCLQLQALRPSQKMAAIASLTPDQVPTQMAAPIKFSSTRTDAPLARLSSLRSGHSTPPLSINFNGAQLTNRLARNAKGGAAGDDSDLFAENRLGVFLQTRFSFGNEQNNNGDRGFIAQSRIATLGADYRFNEHLVAGVAFNYTNQSLGYAQSAGYSNTNTYMGSLYGSYFTFKDFYIDAIASYGGNRYTFSRQYGYAGFSGQSQAKPSGGQYSFALSSGKNFNVRQWLINPYVRSEYLNLQIGQYQEQGGDGFNMTTAAQSSQSFVSDLGLQISYAGSMTWGILTPAIRVEWEHQYLNNNRSIQMQLTQAAPGTGRFVIQTGNPDRDYVNLGGSVSAALPGGGAGFVRYETRLGQSYITEHIVEGGLRLSF